MSQSMSRRAFVGSTVGASAMAAVQRQSGAKADNFLSERYRLTLDRVRKRGTPAYSRELVLADAIPNPVRRFTEFSGDVSGRYIGALSCAAADRHDDYAELRALVPELIRLQKPGGYFAASFAPHGITKEDMAVLWGNGRLLIGLLEYARWSQDADAIAAAKRMGGFLARIAPEMNSETVRKQFESGSFAMGYICWTQIIEGLAELYRVTQAAEYRQVAEEMAERTVRKPGEHSHGFLSSVRGIMSLFEVTGERRWLDRAEQEWQGVMESGNVLAPGSIPEAWKPKVRRTEGCAEADWLRLSLGLWVQTRNLDYLEHAEKTLFNEFCMNQFATGDFGHRMAGTTGSPIGGNQEGGGTARAWWCCTLHGLRAFPDAFERVFHSQNEALAYDLPIEGQCAMEGCTFAAESALESEAAVRLRVKSASGKAVPLLIREPKWAWGIEVTVNGRHVATENEGGYHRLSRSWKTGDVIAIEYRMRTRIERDPSRTGYVSIWHGPWLLGVDEALNPFFFDEPLQLNRLRVRVLKEDVVDLERASEGPMHSFAVLQARFRVSYLPGGYPITPSSAILRPVAEQTGFETTSWEYWFRLES